MAKKRSVWGWTWRVALGVAACPLVILLLVAALIAIPAVQKSLVEKAQRLLEEKVGIEADVGKVSVTGLLALSVEDILARDSAKDTLLYSERLVLDVDLSSIRDSVLSVNTLEFRNVKADTKNLIEAVSIKGNVDRLSLSLGETPITGGVAQITDLTLKGVNLGIAISDFESEPTESNPFGWIFDVDRARLEDIKVSIEPVGLTASLDRADLFATVDIDSESYAVDSLLLGGADVSISGGSYDIEVLKLKAGMVKDKIEVSDLYAEYGPVRMEGKAAMDISTMCVDADLVAALDDMVAKVKASLDIDAEEYDARVALDGALLEGNMLIDKKLLAAADISVSGRGFDPFGRKTRIRAKADVEHLHYEGINISGTTLDLLDEGGVFSGELVTLAEYVGDGLRASAGGSARFSASSILSRPSLSVNANLDRTSLETDSLAIHTGPILLDASTGKSGTSALIETAGLRASASSQSYALDLAPQFEIFANAMTAQIEKRTLKVDALRAACPDISADILLKGDNPLSHILAESAQISFASASAKAELSPEKGVNLQFAASDVCKDTLTLESANVKIRQQADRINCLASVSFDRKFGLPDVTATADGWLADSLSHLRLRVLSDITDGVLDLKDISTALALDLTADYADKAIKADGSLNLRDIKFQDKEFGDRRVSLKLKPLPNGEYIAQAITDSIPATLASPFIPVEGLKLAGEVQASVEARGSLSDKIELSGELTPLGLRAAYEPFDVALALGNTPVLLSDNDIRINKMPIYAADSTCAVLDGKYSLSDGTIDFTLASERFKPSSLKNIRDFSISGDILTAIRASVSGTTESLKAEGRLAFLPETDLKYVIDKNGNNVHAKLDGGLDFEYTPTGGISLKGAIGVPKGQILYSPALYPLKPFNIDKGSRISFDGPVESMNLDITASQMTKAIVADSEERSREVDFNVGVKVSNGLDNLGLDFILSAPGDANIQQEINSFSPEERSRVAAALLATGMYVSDTNIALQESGYALASIMQHSLNALASNKLGRIVDIDLGTESRKKGEALQSSFSLSLSRKFFSDRLKLTVGGSYSGKAEDGAKGGASLDNASAELLLKKGGRTSLVLFHKKNFENIMEGDLYKDGLGIKTELDIEDKKNSSDPYLLQLEGNVAYRSNDQLGPDLSATLSKYNLFGRGETFSTKLQGAYYWKLGERKKGDFLNTDTFQFGADLDLSFPRILVPWKTSATAFPSSTSFDIGYLFNNIAGGNQRHKFTAGVDYSFQTSRRVSHVFSPVKLSFVSNDLSEEYLDKMESIHDFIKTVISDEFNPAMQYRFIYSDAFDQSRSVTTRVDAMVKESGNILAGLKMPGDFTQMFKAQVELRNSFKLGGRSSLATRIFAGGARGYGKSDTFPASEYYYIGGPNSIRAFAPRSIGPGSFKNDIFDLYLYHGGEIKLEANAEWRFPLFWMLEGALFVDAGNVWDWTNAPDDIPDDMKEVLKLFGLNFDYDDGIFTERFLDRVAVGTGFGIRFVYQSIVVRLDTGIAIHAPYKTGVDAYYNIPNFFKDGVRVNFGIGYPF